MTLLLLGAAVGLLALALRGTRRGGEPRAAPIALLIAYLAPVAFLAATLWLARDATELRFALLGLGFRDRAGSPFRVSVGGDRETHDVWISALEERGASQPALLGELVFRPPGLEDGAERPRPPQLAPAPEDPPGLFGVRRPAETIEPLPARRLSDGDRLHVAGRLWEVRIDGGLLGRRARFVDESGFEVEIPRRRGELPLLQLEVPIRRAYPATAETYSLAWLEKAVTGELPEPAPGGFCFWRAGGAELWLGAADAAVRLERAGEEVVREPLIELPPGAGVHVLSHPRWGAGDFRAGGVRDRRSFRLEPGRRSLVVAYDTPEVHVLPVTDLEALAVDAGGGESLRLSLSMGGWQVTDQSLHFRHASRPVALEALASLEIPRAALAPGGHGLWQRRPAFAASTPKGQLRARFGEPFWLGSDRLAAVQLDVLQPPLALAALALFLALFKALAARAAGLAAPQLLFAAAIESLVTLRLLLAYRAWSRPPFAGEALELAMVAWTLLPWSFLLLSAAAPGRGLDRALPALGGWVFSLAWCWQFGGGGFKSWVWVACHLAVLAAAATTAGGGLGAWSDRAAEILGRLRSERRILLLWTAAAVLPGVARIALMTLGFRESLPLGGQRFALTLAHVPAAILVEAAYLVWLWRRLAERGRRAGADLVPGAALAGGPWILPALFVSDLGLALLNLPVFLLAWASVTAIGGRRLAEDEPLGRRWGWHLTPAALLAVYLLVAAFPLGARALIALIPPETVLELESERNYLRLLEFAYPEALEKVARRNSEELSVMSTVMRAYTSGPFGGRGVFATELSPHIEATALREHAPAVLVAAEWGLAGTIGLVLLFAVAAAAGRFAIWRTEERWLEPGEGADGYGGTVAALAALTFAVPSVYMVLANYQLTLFTGKNAYLLGLDSTADVLEVLVLVSLFAAGAVAWRREASP